jgi:hypothetical protein
MPLDPNIILQGQPVQTMNPLDMAAKAMTMKHVALQDQAMEREQANQSNMASILKNNVVTNADGTTGLNKQGALSELYKANPAQAMALQKQMQSQDLDTLDAHTKIAKTLAWSATPENWGYTKQKALDLGLPNADKLPDQYSPEFAQRWQVATLNGEEQIKKAQSDREDDRKREQMGIQQEEFGLKREDTQSNMALRREQMKATQGTRADATNQKMADSLKKDLDADAGRTGNFGTVSKQVLQAQKLEALANQFPDGNLNSRQVEELSLGLANMLSGSSGASRSQVEALVPHTWTGKMANVSEWLTADPKGAGQQAFVKQMMDTVQREKETSMQQLNAIREQRLSAHRNYANSDPSGFKAQLQSYGLDPNNYDANLQPIKKSDDSKKSTDSGGAKKPSWAL